jgi:hypothetical protein
MHTTTHQLRLSDLSAEARRLGFSVRKVDGEYQVYPKGRPKLAYFTTDIDDALGTLRAMAKECWA